jgi:hypothetical protein
MRVTLKDLFSDVVGDMGRSGSTTITVHRGGAAGIKEGYSVPVEDKRPPATVGGGNNH